MKFFKWHFALVISDIDMNAVYRAGRQIGLLAPGWHVRRNPARKKLDAAPGKKSGLLTENSRADPEPGVHRELPGVGALFTQGRGSLPGQEGLCNAKDSIHKT